MKCILALLFVIVVSASFSATLAQTSTSTTVKTDSTTTTVKTDSTTTTVKSTSTPKPTSTTTPTPKSTTTTPATTTTAAPEVHLNTYNVTSGNLTCIQMIAKIDFSIKYEKKGKGNVTVDVPIPKEYTTNGTCGSDNQTLKIMFNDGWELKFTFKKDGKENYHVSDIMLKYILDNHFPDAVKQGTIDVDFKTSKDYMKANDNGYVCNSKIEKENGDVTINTQKLKYKAFNTKGDIDFNTTGLECSADADTNSIVPIAVGAALAGLVVIVLIAYLIGRKRTRKTGYESV